MNDAVSLYPPSMTRVCQMAEKTWVVANLVECRRPPEELLPESPVCSPHHVTVTVVHNQVIKERLNYFMPGVVRDMKLKPEGLVIVCWHNEFEPPQSVRHYDNQCGHRDASNIFGVEKNDAYYWLQVDYARTSGSTVLPASMKLIRSRILPIPPNQIGSGSRWGGTIFDFDATRIIMADDKGLCEETFFWAPATTKTFNHHRMWNLRCASLMGNGGFVTGSVDKTTLHTWRKDEIQRLDHLSLKNSNNPVPHLYH